MKPYPAYKDSDVAWLGQVPEHWGIENLKWLANVELSNVDKKTKEDEPSVELCNYVDVYYHEEIIRSIDFMQATASQNQIDRLSLKAGDVLITKDSETPDDIAVPAYIPESLPGVVCGYHLAQIRPHRSKLEGKYLFRSFQANGIKDQFEFSANGITRFGISKYTIENALFLVPPLPEQTAIADYLDRKTAQIDAVIAKKERLIELLREERTALISQAVTKGLNPAAPMKDSGVAWLGQVPEHWSVENLKWLANVGLSNVDKKTKENEPDVELCNYVDVYYNEEITRSINFMQATASQSQIDRLSLESGDVLITKDSETPDDIAVPAYVPKTLPGVVCGYHLAHIRPHRTKLDGMYLFRSFQANGIKDQFEFSANGITRFGISKYTIENALILVPPLPEQTAIAAYLDQKTSEIDQTIARTETQIVRLREYRTALISAVVTGKVDVRQEAAP